MQISCFHQRYRMRTFSLLLQDHNWTRHISGFDVMKPGPSNTLLAWVGGHGALEMEKLTDSQVIQDCIALLAQFTNTEIPAPIKYYW